MKEKKCLQCGCTEPKECYCSQCQEFGCVMTDVQSWTEYIAGDVP